MALVDDILTSINATLAANLSWLDNTYGKVQRLQRKNTDGKIIRYPGIYIGGDIDNHISLLPDGHLGNYSYFEIDDPVDYGNIDRHIQPRFGFKLVVWFYWPDLYEDWKDRNIEEVKAQVLNVLVASPYARSEDNFRIAEAANEVYRGYTHQEIDNQFLMRPYGGFSIEGEAIAAAACSLELAMPTIPLNLFGLLPFDFNSTEKVLPVFTWDGKPIYVTLYTLADGADQNQTIPGLSDSVVDEIIPWSMRSYKNSVTGNPKTMLAEVERDGMGGFTVFTESFTINNKLLLLSTKA